MSQERPKMRISTASSVASARRSVSQGPSERKSTLLPCGEYPDSTYIVSPISLFSWISSEDTSITAFSEDADVTSDFTDFVLTENDKVTVLMGQTGSGKSTFINSAIGHEVAAVTHAVTSCTQEIQLFQCVHPNHPHQRVFLVDTPGYDNTKAKSPGKVLQHVSEWLIATYRQDVKITGILQFHDITQVRMTGIHRMFLKALSELCGAEFLANVVLVPTGWEDVDNLQAAIKRELDLRTMLAEDHGLPNIRFARFRERTKEAAWSVIDQLQAPGRVLLIQNEVVDQHKLLEDTSVFQSLRKALRWWKPNYLAS